MRLKLIGIALFGVCCAAADLQSLYDRKQLFDLRDAVAQGPAPPFFRAVVACSFNDRVLCVSESQAALASNLSPELAISVYDLLYDFHSAHGDWAEALAAIEAEVALGGDSQDPDNARDMCRAFLRHGAVTVERSGPSSIHVLYKNAHVPFSVNGRPYHAYLDTGANISVLSESAARQLGLAVETANFHFGGAAGKGLDLTHVAVADRLTIGNLELRNVPFIVVSDRRQPFAGWGAGKRSILGLQVLLAARTMTWKSSFPGARLELARPAAARNLLEANFCFDGKTPLAAAEYAGQRLTLFVDTGIGWSLMRAAFATRFPALTGSAPRKIVYFEGVDGETHVEAAMLPLLSLRIGGHNAVFRRIPVYLKGQGAEPYDGMLGNDLSGKAHEFTIDFEAMRLTMK